jgi:hypothetical protein
LTIALSPLQLRPTPSVALTRIEVNICSLSSQKIGLWPVDSLFSLLRIGDHRGFFTDEGAPGGDLVNEIVNAGRPACRFNATVFDAETGEQIATGNGGRDWADGLSMVNWKQVKSHVEASE